MRDFYENSTDVMYALGFILFGGFVIHFLVLYAYFFLFLKSCINRCLPNLRSCASRNFFFLSFFSIFIHGVNGGILFVSVTARYS